MATRLTGFSKLLITLAILAGVFFGIRYFINNTSMGKEIQKQAEESNENSTGTNSGGERDPNTLRVQLVTWGGYAPGLYFNQGAAPSEKSGFFRTTDLRLSLRSKTI